MSADSEPSRPSVQGVGVDARGRCAHWRTDVDIVSFRFPCCEGFWACHDCHEELAHHSAQRWPRHAFETLAVLCGACGARMTIETYLASPDACPRCDAPFNPRCRLHHRRYFEVDGTP
jgi:uncharacterized CHY-type Zn-finger protein